MKTVDISQRKSPIKKLASFFESSRDKWKLKYLDKRDKSILLANKVRAVEKSRQHWREIAEEAKREAQRAQAELHALREEVHAEQLKKSNA